MLAGSCPPLKLPICSCVSGCLSFHLGKTQTQMCNKQIHDCPYKIKLPLLKQKAMLQKKKKCFYSDCFIIAFPNLWQHGGAAFHSITASFIQPRLVAPPYMM